MPEAKDSDALDAAIRHLAPIISHEIRNPMAVINNSAYFLKAKLGKQGEVDPKVLKHLGIIESELRKADSVLGEILAYARMREPAPAVLSLNAVAADAAGSLEAPEGVRLERSLSADDPRVKGDAELLRNAVRHVLRNALEALAAASGGTVRLSTGRAGAEALLEVADDGPGVPEDQRPLLFSPFHTTKARGVGLGLAYCRKVLARHGGRIEFKPSERGARFVLRLPAA